MHGDEVKCLHVRFSKYLGQGTTSLYGYTRGLVDAGNEVHMATLNHNCKSDNLIFHNLNVRERKSLFGKLLSLFQFMISTRKLIEKQKFDVVHVYFFHGCILLPLMNFKNKKSRFILTIPTVSNRKILGKFENMLIKINSITYDLTTSLNNEIFKAIFGKVPKNGYVVPLGCDKIVENKSTRQTCRKKLGFASKDFVFIYVGSVHKKRGIINLLNAFDGVAKSNKHAKLLLIGKGDAVEEIQRAVDKFPNQIIYLGFIPHNKISDFLQAADAGISYVPLVKQYDIQPPLKAYEYLAAGLPVVGTCTMATRRIITHAKNGILSSDRIPDFRGAMQTLINDKELYKQLKKQAKNNADDYSWISIYLKYLQPIYRKFIKSSVGES